MTEHGGSGHQLGDPTAAIRIDESSGAGIRNGSTREVDTHQGTGRHHEAGTPWPSQRAFGSAASATAVADDGAPASDGRDLRSLLVALKMTRQRRDDADYGSPDWLKADDDLRDLQHAIFVIGIEDPTPKPSPERDAE